MRPPTIRSLRHFLMICPFGLIVLFFFMFLDSGEVEISGWEYNVSRKLQDYIYIDRITSRILPEKFCDSPKFLVIMCISDPSGFSSRSVIRETWGKEKTVMGQDISLYFLIGETSNTSIQIQLENESQKHNDIIQERFHDSYNNLTLKSAMMLKLFTMKCQSTARFLLKIDQDMYLNLPKLIEDLLERNKSTELLMGSVICGAKPITDSKNKWYAGPSYMYSRESYPNYISGTSYCMSNDVPEKLLNTSLHTEIFHLEDVYLTGICASKIKLNLTHNGLFTYRMYPTDYCVFKSLITVHYQDPTSIKGLYRAMKDADVDRKCQQEKLVFHVHQWFNRNVVAGNRTWRRRVCGY
ncbi:beta-1,3-galactosyltransferase 5-like [Sitophilus oryzae]|uniref:Hexosyltransferase n=1 Tax=Sitophilus oryzae TaxID=7048 RepID=A0A6J2Y8H1_SITOR|nr:beta-1,3-galactosyltransferase 5-like [Sitophilus oryzae]